MYLTCLNTKPNLAGMGPQALQEPHSTDHVSRGGPGEQLLRLVCGLYASRDHSGDDDEDLHAGLQSVTHLRVLPQPPHIIPRSNTPREEPVLQADDSDVQCIRSELLRPTQDARLEAIWDIQDFGKDF